MSSQLVHLGKEVSEMVSTANIAVATTKAVARGVLIRKLATTVFSLVRETPIMERLIYRFALFVRSLPAGDDIGAEVINTMPEDLRSLVEPIWREINHLSEEDMNKRFNRDNSKQNKGQGEQSPGQQQNRSQQDYERALTNMAALDPKLSIFFSGLLAAQPPATRMIIQEAVGRIYKTVPLLTSFLTPLLIRHERGEKINLLEELGMNPLALDSPKKEDKVGDAKTAHTVQAWLRQKDEAAFKKVMEIMTSDALDSEKGRPAFYGYLASLHHLGEEEAVIQLQTVAEIEDLGARASYVGVHPKKRTFGSSGKKATEEMLERATNRRIAAEKELADYRKGKQRETNKKKRRVTNG